MIRILVEPGTPVGSTNSDARFEIISAHDAATADVILTNKLRSRHIGLGSPPIVLIDDTLARATPLPDGVAAILPTDIANGDLVAVIEAVAQGFVVLTASQSKRLLRRKTWANTATNEMDDVQAEALTGRETEVLRMLADGLENKEIAGQLSISDHTAKFHVAQILAKLRAASRTEAVAIALRKGLIPI